MNAYETEHIGLDKQAYKAGQAGGDIQKKQFYHLANELGYKLEWGGLFVSFTDMPHFQLGE